MNKNKYLKPFFLLPLMVAIGLLVVSCSSDEETEGVLVPEAEISEEVSNFFNDEFPSISNTYLESFFLHEDRSAMYVINDQEQLLRIYHGDGKLPEIDFQKYSLVIGKELIIMKIGEKYPVKLNNKSLYRNGEYYSLNLYCDYVIPEVTINAYRYIYYWGIYPKIKDNKISVNIKMG